MTKIIAGIRCTLIQNLNRTDCFTPHVGVLMSYNNRTIQGFIPKIIWEAALTAPLTKNHESKVQKETQEDNPNGPTDPAPGR